MTNKEAIEWIERIICLHQVEDMNVTLTDRREYEALELAIKALEEYPTDKEIQDAMQRTYLGGKEE